MAALDSGRRLLLETAELDELPFFEPMILVDKERATSALLEFMNLPDRNDAAAVDYMNKFGAFDDLEVESGRFVGDGIPHSVQQFCRRCIKERKHPYAASLSLFWAVRDDINGLWNLSMGLDAKEPQIVREECLRRRPYSSFESASNWLAVGQRILCADLTSSLNPPGHRNPRLCLSVKYDNLVATTMAKSVRSALYLTLLDLIVSKTGYKKCPNCEEHFIVTVKRKKYCKEACQNAAKVRRFRFVHDQDAHKEQARRASDGTPTRR